MRGTADLHLLDTPDPRLLAEVTGGLKTDRRGSFAMLKPARIRSTQRLAIGDVGGGIMVFTWPGELIEQAEHLYTAGRGHRLLEAADVGGWEVDTRPHLAFWLSSPDERLYMNPHPTMDAATYVERWSGADGTQIGAHPSDAIRSEVWPWLLKRGYTSPQDEPELDPFLDRLEKRNRDAHLRPGLRLLRRWERDEVATLRARHQLAGVVRKAVNQLLRTVDDPLLPMR